MSELVYLLDSEGLSQALLGNRVMGARLKDADRSGIRVVTSSMTLIEAYHQRVKKAAWTWTLSKIAVEPVTREIAGEAIELLETAGLHGRKYAVDAALAAVALRQRGDVTIFTSDEEDMKLLCGDRVVVQGI
ncbi:PIN domain-containing protein [Streptomyces sp. AP-93]|uniref:PIN domain-containing protein n=1 Tax=Streptomyces sp. AP-93 TaxID=2929048 RepID=UPI001FAFA1DA|nr:PIN domain-containing protein [Streptomyces sp. AP-93]MCJ0872163.1 PIN domain-containing protein [Streptomyces sp. AP-93]